MGNYTKKLIWYLMNINSTKIEVFAVNLVLGNIKVSYKSILPNLKGNTLPIITKPAASSGLYTSELNS